MAETTQERKTFKWGDREYLLDDLLKLHSELENHFYNFAKNKGQYDDTALMGLRQAIADRINAAKAGETFAADGVLGTDTAKNIQIQTLKRGLFKKEKYVDQDNTEWARYYVNKLVGLLNPYLKPADKDSWDVKKHGLEAYLTGLGLRAQDIFEGMDGHKSDDPNEVRSFKQRHDSLRTHLAGYKDWLTNKGFDFTKNDNDWDDDFMTTLNSLINKQSWDDSIELQSSLRKLGAGNDYTTAFTSDRWDLSKSQGELDAESKKRKEEEEAKLKELHMKEALDYFHSLKRQSNAIYAEPFNYSKHKFKEGVTANFADWYNDLNASERSKYGTHLGRDSKTWGSAWNLLMNSLKSGQQYADENLGMLLQGTFETLPQQFRDLGDGNYLIMDSITDSGQGTVYNPNSGYMDTVFLGDIADRNVDIMNAYKNLAYKYANNKYNTNYENKRYLFKEGGEIPKHQYGNSVNYNWENNNKALELRAKTNNVTEDQQKARERYINANNKSVDNPDAGFTGADIARLVSIGADITSIFLDPVTGTAVGLGSTLANFGADIADDGFQWEDVKNLGINAGFDLLGAIPLFGDALGTGTKITRLLVKWAPRVMAGLAAYQGVANFDGMMHSWSKFVSGDKDLKLTVLDWRNLAQSIGLITGGTRAIKNKAAQANMKKQAKVDGVVGVNVRDKNTGEIKQLLIDGDAAKNIRSHKGDKTKIENELAQLETLKNKFGEKGDFEVVTKGGKWQRPLGRSENADGSKSWELRGLRGEGRADVRDVYDFSRVQQGPHSIGYLIPVVSLWLNNKHQMLMNRLNPGLNQQSYVGAKTSKQIDEEIAKLRLDQNSKAGVDTEIANVKAAMEARGKALKRVTSELTSARKKLKDLQKKLNGVADEATLTGNKTKLESDLAALEIQIQQRLDQLNTAQADLLKLLNKKRIPKKQQKAHAAAVKSARGRVSGHQAVLNGHNAKKQQLTSNINLTNTHLRNWKELTPIQANVKRLNDINSRLSQKNHTNAYNRLQQILSDLQTNHSSIGGRQINWDMLEILKQAGLQNAFKLGGSINRNKINKFINYAKG